MRLPCRRVQSATKMANDESWGGGEAGNDECIFKIRNAFVLAGSVVSCTVIDVSLSSDIRFSLLLPLWL